MGRRSATICNVARGLAAICAMCVALPGLSAELRAGPNEYREVVKTLRPGDTLVLEPGNYTRGLDVHGVSGTPAAPIAIVGARGTARSVFVASPERNTISIANAAFVRVADLDLEGHDAPVDAVKAEGTARYAHHIVVEGLRISGYAASQQNVGISTKCPAWGWTIRGNRIADVGTGIYLGNSEDRRHSYAESSKDNVVTGNPRIRDADQASECMAGPDPRHVARRADHHSLQHVCQVREQQRGRARAPSLLLGHWPLAGRGSSDRYLVYGNLFLDNPTEALFQAEGNVTRLQQRVRQSLRRCRRGPRAQRCPPRHRDVPQHHRGPRHRLVAAACGRLVGASTIVAQRRGCRLSSRVDD